MARTITKSGSKVIQTCPVCGKSMTKAGLIGHMRFKHGRDHKAPMIPVEVKSSQTSVDHVLHCPDCLKAVLAGLSDVGYTIKPPIRVYVDLQGHVTQILDKAPLNDVAPQKLAKRYTIKVKKS